MAVKARQDERPMSVADILFEANKANAGALMPLPMSSAHHLQWATQITEAMRQAQHLPLAPGNANVEETAADMIKCGNIPSSQKGFPVGLPTLKRFTTIGTMQIVSPRMKDLLLR